MPYRDSKLTRLIASALGGGAAFLPFLHVRLDRYLPIPPYTSLNLPVPPCTSLYLPVPPCTSLYLPISQVRLDRYDEAEAALGLYAKLARVAAIGRGGMPGARPAEGEVAALPGGWWSPPAELRRAEAEAVRRARVRVRAEAARLGPHSNPKPNPHPNPNPSPNPNPTPIPSPNQARLGAALGVELAGVGIALPVSFCISLHLTCASPYISLYLPGVASSGIALDAASSDDLLALQQALLRAERLRAHLGVADPAAEVTLSLSRSLTLALVDLLPASASPTRPCRLPPSRRRNLPPSPRRSLPPSLPRNL